MSLNVEFCKYIMRMALVASLCNENTFKRTTHNCQMLLARATTEKRRSKTKKKTTIFNAIMLPVHHVLCYFSNIEQLSERFCVANVTTSFRSISQILCVCLCMECGSIVFPSLFALTTWKHLIWSKAPQLNLRCC